MGDSAYERRRALVPWRAWYHTGRWRALRADQLRREPHCRTCAGLGATTAATVCDHMQPHRGDERLFWRGPFQSLCAAHHSSDKQSLEHGRPRPPVGADGWPKG